MAGLGPSMAPPGGPVPPGPMMPQGAPPAPPPPAPPAGVTPPPPRPPTPFAGLTELSSEMSPGWQMIDGMASQCKLTIRMPDLMKVPKVVAVLYSVLETLTNLMSHYVPKGDAGGAPTSVASDASETGGDVDAHYASTDVGAAPEQSAQE